MLWHTINRPLIREKNLFRTLFTTSALVFLSLVSILISTNIIISASTPEPSQEPVEIVQNQTPEATEQSSVEPISMPPTDISLIRCAIQDEIPANAVELTFFIEENSFILHLNANQPDADLSQLGFEYSINGIRDYLCLRDLASFVFLQNNLLASPSCLRLIRQGTVPVLPSDCNGLSIDFVISNADIFWYDNHARSFIVLNGNEQIDFCGTSLIGICNIDLGTPLPLLANSVTIHLAWDTNYLVVYVDDAGLFNLDELRIMDNANMNGSIPQQEAAFESLRFDEIPGPICFYYIRNNRTTSPSDDCLAHRWVIEHVSNDDVFWHVGGSNIPLLVFVDNIQIRGICVNPCTRQLP